MHRKSQRLCEILDELKDLHIKKSRDYGQTHDPFSNIVQSQDWGVRPWVGAMVRAGDKVHRLKIFATRGSLANEGAKDSLRDLIVYSAIALVELEQEELEKDLQGT